MTRRRPYDWERDEQHELVADASMDDLRRTLARVHRFIRSLKDQGVHVGVGSPARCATCETPWPCHHARDAG